MTTFKTCNRCKQSKPIDEFHRQNRVRDGRQPYCKQCRIDYGKLNKAQKTEYDRAHYQANADRLRAESREYRAAHPEYHANYNHNYYTQNRGKIADTVRKWQESNREKVRAIKVKHKAAKRNADGRFTDSDVRAMLKSQRGRCVYCQCDISHSYTVDHVTPLSKGGSNWPDNLQLLCAACNSSKKDRTHEEYIAYLKVSRR